MDLNKGLMLLAAFLLLIDGVGHLAAATIAADMEMAVLAFFGVVYVATGVGLLAGKGFFCYLGIVFPIAGVAIGTYSYVAMNPNPVVLVFISIAIAIILCCSYLVLRHKCM